MTKRRLVSAAAICGLAIACAVQQRASAQNAGHTRMYNTAKQKLMAGKQIFGATITSPDPNIYCTVANSGYDFVWIEMQHSPMTWEDVAHLIWSCRGSSAMPFVRVPDATESDIQKATDIGAIGIIVPTVDTVEKAEAAVKWSRYPPQGRRSQGLGKYRQLWGNDYRQTANENMFVGVMIETPIGVDNVEKIASVPGIDMIFAASTDLGNFSGHKQGDPEYEAMVKRIHDVTLAHGIKLGGPQAWKDRAGFTFFQAPDETALLRFGAQVNLGIQPAPVGTPGRRGVAPIEGAEK